MRRGDGGIAACGREVVAAQQPRNERAAERIAGAGRVDRRDRVGIDAMPLAGLATIAPCSPSFSATIGAPRASAKSTSASAS